MIENGDITDIHRVEEKVNRKFADGLDPTAPVTIMTIHKAKGLEFDHVFSAPGLSANPGPTTILYYAGVNILIQQAMRNW